MGDKVLAARRKADALSPRGGVANLNSAIFDASTRDALQKIARKALRLDAGKRAHLASIDVDDEEATRRLINAAQFAAIRLYICKERPDNSLKLIQAFIDDAQSVVAKWKALGSLQAPIIEGAIPEKVSRNLDEINSAIVGAAGILEILKSSRSHAPADYAFVDTICAAWVEVGLRPGFSASEVFGAKSLGLFEQFANAAAAHGSHTIKVETYRETIKRQSARLPKR